MFEIYDVHIIKGDTNVWNIWCVYHHGWCGYL